MDVTSNFGRAIADVALREGDFVVGTIRQYEKILPDLPFPDNFHSIEINLGEPASLLSDTTEIWQIFGHVDVLVTSTRNRIILGAVEEVNEIEAMEVFKSNYFSALNLIRAILPLMRDRRRGHIINLSSAGGFLGSAGFGAYNASKFALEGVSEALAQELQPLGIHVTIVEPGYFHTDVLNASSLELSSRIVEDYYASSGRARQLAAQQKGPSKADLAGFAKAIYDLTRSPNPPLRLVLGADALERIRMKISSLSSELKTWEKTSISAGSKNAVFKV